MGLLKGSVTFSRYRIAGALPDHFPKFFNERIRRYAFQTVWRTTDEKAAGWTSVDKRALAIALAAALFAFSAAASAAHSDEAPPPTPPQQRAVTK